MNISHLCSRSPCHSTRLARFSKHCWLDSCDFWAMSSMFQVKVTHLRPENMTVRWEPKEPLQALSSLGALQSGSGVAHASSTVLYSIWPRQGMTRTSCPPTLSMVARTCRTSISAFQARFLKQVQGLRAHAAGNGGSPWQTHGLGSQPAAKPAYRRDVFRTLSSHRKCH